MNTRRPLRTMFTALTAALLLNAGTATSQTLRTVALSGQPAPGMASGINFSTSFGTPVLNDAGQTAFFAGLTRIGGTTADTVSIWSEGSGSLALVARTGDPAPGTSSGVIYDGVDRFPLLNATGQTAFSANLTGSGVTSANNTGIWSEGSGSVTLIAREGDPAPGTPTGVNYGGFSSPRSNAAGQTAFSALLTGNGVTSANNSGIWSEGSGSLALVAREGNPAPGTPSGVNYSSIFGPPELNDAGQTAFLAGLNGSGVTSANDLGIWSEGSGSLALVARTGNQAPGTSSGVRYSSFLITAPLALNGAGQTAFYAELTGSGVTGATNEGIWSEGSGSLALVAREGNPAPGTSSGVNYGGILGSPVLNDAGQTAFGALLTGSGVTSANDSGIWSEGSGAVTLLAREGDPAPGTSGGVNFSILFSPVLNSTGQTAFLADLIGSSVTTENDIGIWATDANDVLRLIVREGDPLEVAPGDFRTVLSLFVANIDNGDTRPRGFNSLGQLAFTASFTDNTWGVFVSNLVAIPEPASLTLVAVGAFVIRLRRRWR